MSSEQPDISPNNSNVGENGQPLTEAEIKARKNRKKKERAKRKKAAAKEAAASAASASTAAEGNGTAAGKSNGMDNSTRSAGGGKARNNQNQNKNNGGSNNNNNNELVAKLKAREVELEQAQQVIAGLMSKGKGLEKDKSKLQEELTKIKNNFEKDKAQLEENLKLAHKAQMDQAMAKQKSLQTELDKALAGAGRTAAAAAPAGGNGVADVWQTKCVATAKQLKEEQKYVKMLEAEKKELEKQLEFASKEKKPWWMCG